MGKKSKNFKEVNLLTRYKIMLVGPICEKLKSSEFEISKLNSRQIRALVIQEWKALKDRAKKKQNKIELSEEEERRIINWFVYQLSELKEEKENTKS